MTTEDLFLALIPPTLAIIVERFNPVNLEGLKRGIKSDFEEFSDYSSHSEVLETVANYAAGAVELSGSAPTFIAGITAGFAILHDEPVWAFVAYCVPFIAGAVVVVWFASSRSYLDLAIKPAFPRLASSPGRLPARLSGARGVDVIGWAIYTINALVILTAVTAYMVGPHKEKESAGQHSSAQQSP